MTRTSFSPEYISGLSDLTSEEFTSLVNNLKESKKNYPVGEKEIEILRQWASEILINYVTLGMAINKDLEIAVVNSQVCIRLPSKE